jgi:hypothetical protein
MHSWYSLKNSDSKTGACWTSVPGGLKEAFSLKGRLSYEAAHQKEKLVNEFCNAYRILLQ